MINYGDFHGKNHDCWLLGDDYFYGWLAMVINGYYWLLMVINGY